MDEMDSPTNMYTAISKLPFKWQKKWRGVAWDIQEKSGMRARFRDGHVQRYGLFCGQTCKNRFPSVVWQHTGTCFTNKGVKRLKRKMLKDSEKRKAFLLQMSQESNKQWWKWPICTKDSPRLDYQWFSEGRKCQSGEFWVATRSSKQNLSGNIRVPYWAAGKIVLTYLWYGWKIGNVIWRQTVHGLKISEADWQPLQHWPAF